MARRRTHIVEISPDGEAELAAANARITTVDDEVLHGLSTEERAALYRLLVRASEPRSHRALNDTRTDPR